MHEIFMMEAKQCFEALKAKVTGNGEPMTITKVFDMFEGDFNWKYDRFHIVRQSCQFPNGDCRTIEYEIISTALCCDNMNADKVSIISDPEKNELKFAFRLYDDGLETYAEYRLGSLPLDMVKDIPGTGQGFFEVEVTESRTRKMVIMACDADDAVNKMWMKYDDIHEPFFTESNCPQQKPNYETAVTAVVRQMNDDEDAGHTEDE